MFGLIASMFSVQAIHHVVVYITLLGHPACLRCHLGMIQLHPVPIHISFPAVS